MTSPRAQEALEARATRPGWALVVVEMVRGGRRMGVGVAHHVPEGDLQRHETGTGRQCACGAWSEPGHGSVAGVAVRMVVWHSAWDGRDLVAMVEETGGFGE